MYMSAKKHARAKDAAKNTRDLYPDVTLNMILSYIKENKAH